MDEMKPWRCKNGHVMGRVFRNGSRAQQMVLFREAMDMEPSDDELAEVDVMAIVDGHVVDIRCSICGALRTWAPGKEALRRLVESVGRELIEK